MQPLLAIYGARGSGLDYMSGLLLANAVCRVANFDKNPAARVLANPLSVPLYAAHGSKHSLLDRAPDDKYPRDAICVFVFKPIFSWVASRLAYHRSSTKLPLAELPDFVRQVIAAEYLPMLGTLADHLEGALKDQRVSLVNFDAVVPSGLEGWLAGLGLACDMPLQGVHDELKAGGGLGRGYWSKGPEKLVPESDLHADLLNICAQALGGVDGRILELYEQIFGTVASGQLDGAAAVAPAADTMGQAIASFWTGRFTVYPQGESDLVLKDRLQPDVRVAPRALFAGLSPRMRDLTFFRQGLVRPVLGAVGATVVEAARGPDDLLAWHGAARTEQAAMAVHGGLVGPLLADGAMHVYLGLPWATWIDRMLASGHGRDAALPAAITQQLQLVGIQLLGYRHALAELGTRLCVHTVCQHLQWAVMLAAWRDLGVTDLWLSQCPHDSVPGINLHPWRLWAAQVEDPRRADGLRLMADPVTKPLLASFVGHLSEHAIDDIRPRLAGLADAKRLHITLLPAAPAQAGAGASAWPESAAFNQVLSDSVFSLCPAGAGANTARLWESLAVGAVPVLIGGPSSQPRLPEGGSLPAVDWSSIVVQVSGGDLAGLPALLASMPLDEVRRRQQLGREAFEQACRQRCF